jgi:amino acid transporter
LLIGCFNLGSFDSSVHISEEASNAASAVPWAIVNAVAVSGVLGFGMLPYLKFFFSWTNPEPAAINMALAFCMGSNLELLVNSNQPMALIFLNSFGLKPTLAVWAVVIIVQ